MAKKRPPAKHHPRRKAGLAQNSEGSASSPKRKRGRGPGRPFKPGQSGNPGGRPRMLKELKDRIQLRGLDLVDVLFGIVDGLPLAKGRGVVGPSHRERILATKELMAYGYGRPVLAVEVSGPGGGPLEGRDISLMTSAERRQRLKQLTDKAAAGAVGAAAAGEEDDDDDDAGGG